MVVAFVGGIVLGLIAGFLVGRKHPVVAEKVAEVADKVVGK